jgi:hypothetical protein
MIGIVACVGAGLSARAEEDGGVKLRFSLTSASNAAPATVTVSGKVIDKVTNQPIPNASVRGDLVIYGQRGFGPGFFDSCPYQETTANPAGEYTLKFVTPLTTSGPMQGKDELCVYAGAPGYETRPIFAKKKVTPKGLDYRIDFALDKGKLIRGTVVDENHKPVAGARVRIQNSSSGVWTYFDSFGRTTTDKDGNFQIWCTTEPDLITNNPWLQVFKPGYGAGFYFDILAKEDMGTLVLPKGGEIRGRAVDARGKGVGDCEVYATTSFIEPIMTARTDADGRYVLSGIPGEPSIVSFYEKKNGRYEPMWGWGKVEVYARTDPALSLSEAPSYRLMAQEGKTSTAPNLVCGDSHSVSGRLIASKSTLVGLKGLLVSLDDGIGKMPEADGDGKFYFPFVSPGKHQLYVYLPTNVGNRWGIGRTQIVMPADKKLDGVEVALDDLAEARVQFLDAHGNPLEGITAGASFRRDEASGREGSSRRTIGTRSGTDGWAVIYLYIFPFGPQYVYGADLDARKLVSTGSVEVNPKPGEVLNNLRITIVPAGSITGRLLDENTAPVPRQFFLATIDYADKLRETTRVATDKAGRFEIPEVKPGVVRLWLEAVSTGQVASFDKLTEIRPGVASDLGDQRLAVGTVPLPAGKYYQVRGRVKASPTFSALSEFKIRLGWMDWKPMESTDAVGNFVIKQVPPGKHLLTAYLPFNLRGDRGVGHVEVDVKDGNVEGVELPLDTLTTVQMRIEDSQGRPLEGISAAAWWNPEHFGIWTEGSRSSKEGRATLYLYADGQEQFVGAEDLGGQYVLKADHKITPKKGEVVKGITVIMQRK